MSCSSSTIGRLRRDGSERHAVARRRRTHHCRGAGVDRSAPRRGPRICGRREHRGACRRLAGRGPAAGPCRPTTARPVSRAARWRDRRRRATRPAPSSARRSKPSLDELGATTLVICGALATHALEASARHAADLGYQVFVVADACRAADALDLNGRLWPAEDVRALALARLERGRRHRRRRDGASGRGDGQGAPAPSGGKGLTARPEFNCPRKCSVLRATQSFQ